MNKKQEIEFPLIFEKKLVLLSLVDRNCRACGIDISWELARRQVCRRRLCAKRVRRESNAARPEAPYIPKPWSCMRCGSTVAAGGSPRCCQQCSEAARKRQSARDTAKKRRRRVALLGRPSEVYTTVGIAERDGFRCGLCTEPVDMGLSGRDPMGPTIDHVLPIALGGDDTRANVQLAHLSCNMRKGARELSRV